jgi:putative FmdB family regulatory protein
MPIYEYRCAQCAHEFEKLMRRWDDLTTCPACSSHAVEKQISTFAVSSSPGSGSLGCGAPAAGCGAPACGGGSCGMPN